MYALVPLQPRAPRSCGTPPAEASPYPDISALGGQVNSHCLHFQGRFGGVAGTSASCPVASSVFAKLNDIRCVSFFLLIFLPSWVVVVAVLALGCGSLLLSACMAAALVLLFPPFPRPAQLNLCRCEGLPLLASAAICMTLHLQSRLGPTGAPSSRRTKGLKYSRLLISFYLGFRLAHSLSFPLPSCIRLKAGKSALGFLNPFIYQNAAAFNDVTTGCNKASGPHGFTASKGWDPATGVGTPNFAALSKLM
jgi:hypothetical protein